MFERNSMEQVFTGDWYPWYPEKALTSEAIDGLSMAEEGAYRRALDKAWIKGSIPSDPKEAAKVIGKGCTPKMAARILTLFVPIRGNKKRSVNLPQERIRAEQKEKHEKAVNRSQIAANKRWAEANRNGGANATSIPQAMLKDANKNKSKSIEEEIKNKEEEKSKSTPQAASKKPEPQTFPIPRSDASPELWDEWLEVRRKIKKPLTQRGYDNLIRDLSTLVAFDINERLEQAIDRKWQGLVFKEDKNGNARNTGTANHRQSEREKSAERGSNTLAAIAELRRQGEIEEQEILSRGPQPRPPDAIARGLVQPYRG